MISFLSFSLLFSSFHFFPFLFLFLSQLVPLLFMTYFENVLYAWANVLCGHCETLKVGPWRINQSCCCYKPGKHAFLETSLWISWLEGLNCTSYTQCRYYFKPTVMFFFPALGFSWATVGAAVIAAMSSFVSKQCLSVWNGKMSRSIPLINQPDSALIARRKLVMTRLVLTLLLVYKVLRKMTPKCSLDLNYMLWTRIISRGIEAVWLYKHVGTFCEVTM